MRICLQGLKAIPGHTVLYCSALRKVLCNATPLSQTYVSKNSLPPAHSRVERGGKHQKVLFLFAGIGVSDTADVPRR